MVFDAPGHVRLPINDDEIIDKALVIQPLAGREVTLLTYDTGQSTRARSAGLRVHKLTPPDRRRADAARQSAKNQQLVSHLHPGPCPPLSQSMLCPPRRELCSRWLVRVVGAGGKPKSGTSGSRWAVALLHGLLHRSFACRGRPCLTFPCNLPRDYSFRDRKARFYCQD